MTAGSLGTCKFNVITIVYQKGYVIALHAFIRN